jgi:anthranilate phosphoribosyltransferase
VQRACVVYGEDGLDEVTLGGRTFVCEVNAGREAILDYQWTPADLGVARAEKTSLAAADAAESAAIILSVLDNAPGPARDVVVANAAAALFTAEKTATVAAGADLARSVLASGAARATLQQLVAISQRR